VHWETKWEVQTRRARSLGQNVMDAWRVRAVCKFVVSACDLFRSLIVLFILAQLIEGFLKYTPIDISHAALK